MQTRRRVYGKVLRTTACFLATSGCSAFLQSHRLPATAVSSTTCRGPRPCSTLRLDMRSPQSTTSSHFLACFLAATISAIGPADISSLQPNQPLMTPPPVWAEPIPDSAYANLASLELWQQTKQPEVEIATILKDRGNARQFSNPSGALEDLNAALGLYAKMSTEDRPLEEVVGATFLRAQVHQRLADLEAAERDFSAALELDEENPFVWSERGDNRLRRGNWAGAAQDFLQAETQFKLIGDKIRRTLAAADASIAMLGSGDKAAALQKMAQVGKQARFDVASNDPENIPNLQEIARKEAELHLVRAGVAWKEGKQDDAAAYWARGCVRLEGYTMDAANRNVLKASKEAEAARRTLTGPSSQDKAEDALAALVGMRPDSNYVKDRESDKPLWNQFVPGKATSFDPKAVLPDQLGEFVGCRPFYDPVWVRENRLWPPEVQDGVKAFVTEFDLGKINNIKETQQFKVSWDEMT